ncbi:hypothetical protein J3E64_000082 [Sphingobium sp. OAS761]|nr:hypothetical protein [Sphingobium sp. OAS761]
MGETGRFTILPVLVTPHLIRGLAPSHNLAFKQKAGFRAKPGMTGKGCPRPVAHRLTRSLLRGQALQLVVQRLDG